MTWDSVAMYVFSGTGNTLRAARALEGVFVEAGASVRLAPLERGFREEDLEGADLLGVGFPVAAFTTYPPVWEALQALPPGRGKPLFAFATMAGAALGLGGAVRALVRRKGYTPYGYREFIMPSNYLRKEAAPTERDQEILAAGEEAARAFGEALRTGRQPWKGSGLAGPLQSLGRSRFVWNWMAHSSFSEFSADPDRCVRCGRCARLCPAGNIAWQEGLLPVWQDRCVVCQRCAAVCPHDAVRLPKGAVPYRAADPEIPEDGRPAGA